MERRFQAVVLAAALSTYSPHIAGTHALGYTSKYFDIHDY